MMKKLILAAAIAAIAGGAQAETQGTLSESTSTGSAVVTAVIPPMVMVSGLNDITMNITAAQINNQFFNRIDADEPFCVYSNSSAAGNYKLTLNGTAGSGGGTPWRLTGAGGNLDYAVWTTDRLSNTFRNFAFPGVEVAGYAADSGVAGQRPTTTDCGGNSNANLKIGINDANILAAVAGTYTGTLTVVVSVP